MCVVNKMHKLVSQCIDFIISCQQNLVIDPKAFHLITYKLYIDKAFFFFFTPLFIHFFLFYTFYTNKWLSKAVVNVL